ncbi:peroxisomal acyl-coenzyme A oxidase 3-like, partial [Homalodisca vitripennis]|uniref:peroxisomal acyl-coenzyme A oxidase 3-like n=1 Tax=Homalodisca vitripennis TaxID=197043 RepID=UPI001EEC6B51
ACKAVFSWPTQAAIQQCKGGLVEATGYLEKMDALTEMHALLSACKAVFSWPTQAAILQCKEACGGHRYLEKMDALTEMHALLSACKAVFSWTTQAAIQQCRKACGGHGCTHCCRHARQCSAGPPRQPIQQCREACGGHGYLKCAGFAGLRNDNDASCTYEGDNNVLQQQASQWVVRLWGQRQEQRDQFPLGSVDLLYRSRADHMSAASEREFCHPPVLLEAYEWLVCWLVEKTSQLYQSQVERGTDRFHGTEPLSSLSGQESLSGLR